MDTLNNIILEKRKKIEQIRNQKPVRINLKWEQAKYFCKYCGFNVDNGIIVFVLKLCRIYGENRVYNLKSWLKDASYDPSRLQGLLVWKLKSTENTVHLPY